MLLPELLLLISERVAEIGDYVRFGAVCKPWFYAASPPATLPPQKPWLLLPYDAETTLRSFYSLSRRRLYRFDLPIFRERVIFSSSQGWLIMADASFSVTLFNPFTQDQIDLPSLSNTFGDIYDVLLSARDEIVSANGGFDSKTRLLVLSRSLLVHQFITGGGECILAFVIARRKFAYCKVQDKVWIRTDCELEFPIETVGYHRGRFYIVYEDGVVATCKLSPEAKAELIPSLRVTLNLNLSFLVTVGRELIMVVSSCDAGGKALLWDCFKLDTIEQRWSKILDIGHHALFLQLEFNLIAAAVGETSQRARNCIFMGHFLDDSSLRRGTFVTAVSIREGRMRIMPLFKDKSLNLNLQSIRFMPHLESFWFTPSL